MAELHKAEAAAREAHAEYAANPHVRGCADACAYALRDLLAALDAARGEAVAWVDPGWLDDVRNLGDMKATLYRARSHSDLVPIYAAPPAAPRVERYGDGVLVHWPDGVEQYVCVGDCVTGNLGAMAVPDNALRDALEGLLSITRDSAGVAGYHLNGAVAEWGEFPEVAAAEAALAQQPAAAVPDGMALVPVEPTEHMENEGALAQLTNHDASAGWQVRKVWDAMLAAANKENNNG